MTAVYPYRFPIGQLTIGEAENGICLVKKGYPENSCTICETPLIVQAKAQLDAYFAGTLQQFTLPLTLKGTAFQQKVWQALLRIPYGQVRSYGQIAKEIGCPKGSRAVGMANHHNPVSIMVPCHRVIGANGKLTGYGGGLAMKQFLLELEGIPVTK